MIDINARREDFYLELSDGAADHGPAEWAVMKRNKHTARGRRVGRIFRLVEVDQKSGIPAKGSTKVKSRGPWKFAPSNEGAVSVSWAAQVGRATKDMSDIVAGFATGLAAEEFVVGLAVLSGRV